MQEGRGYARQGVAGALTGGKGAADATAAADHEPLRRRQDVDARRTSLENDAMPITAGWAVGVATLLLLLGTPQGSRAKATISFASRYDYFCWNPGA